MHARNIDVLPDNHHVCKV